MLNLNCVFATKVLVSAETETIQIHLNQEFGVKVVVELMQDVWCFCWEGF